MHTYRRLLFALAATACGSTAPAEPVEPADPAPSAEVAAPEPSELPVAAQDTLPTQPQDDPPAEPTPEAAHDSADPGDKAAARKTAPAAKAAKVAKVAKPVAPSAPAAEPVPEVKAKSVVGTFQIAPSSKASFLIDAPLEKIKGRWSKTGGTLTIDPSDLTKTRGNVTIDLLTMKTHTFGNAGKDARQGEHALNWMEVGTEVSASTRAKYRTARFTIERIDSAKPNQAGARSRVRASGKLRLHGRTLAKTVELDVSFEGPADAPTTVKISTAKPLSVSLRAHDIKPRDLAGRFLAGALDKVGQKIADRVGVSLRLAATRR